MNGHTEAVLNEAGDQHKKDAKAIPPVLLALLKAALAKFGPILLAWLEQWLSAEKAKVAADAKAAGV